MRFLPERIELARINLVRNAPTDAEEIFYAYASKPEATHFMAWKRHESLDDTRMFLRWASMTWEDHSQFAYAVRLRGTNRLIGGCGCTQQDGLFQVGYIFSPTVWGQGYATEACTGLVAAIQTNPITRKITSFVDAENIPSMRVLEKSGFIRTELAPQYFMAINQNGIKKDAWLFQHPFTGLNSRI